LKPRASFFPIGAFIIGAAALSHEYFALNFDPPRSAFAALRERGWLARGFSLDPSAGGTISLWLGWAGIALMLAAGLYVVRKRLPGLKGLGSMGAWLNFHIFCGMMGPLLILFHTNFHVGGMAAVAFWAMSISFGSGLIGRYFYLQVARQKSDLERDAAAAEKNLDRFEEIYPAWLGTGRLAELQQGVFALAGAASAGGSTILRSLVGDLRLRYRFRGLTARLPRTLRTALKPELLRLAIARRRIRDLESFRRIMGYWHAFHAPFAIVMYVTALGHIAASLYFMTRS
jgi:LPXTG-motif cell wall-anchored protein